MPGEVAQTPTFRHASRLQDGRALVLDVWSVFNAANLPADTINLGQGYMNFAPPEWARAGAEDALAGVDGNHYAPPKGIKGFYGTEFGKELDIETEIVVTSGANEGQYSAFAAFIESGDEVIIFEPFFDQYLPSIAFQGGKCVYVPLHPNDCDNTPHNPVGKVFTRAELQGIARVAQEHNLIVMSDEVYEKLVFDENEHVRIAALPGMWERTITVGSAGKLFAATGWRIGWLVGPPALIGPTLAASTRIIFCSNSPMQEAAAAGLERAAAHNFFAKQVKEYEERRSVLVDAFESLGLQYTWPEGSYFILLDVSRVQWPQDFPFPPTIQARGRDFKAAWFLANEIGVSCIPVTDFYCEEHVGIGENYARFAFCKDLDTLRRAAERLQRLREFIV
ncbi:PLP-dependent transferase [Epithele typhae]|uniref:PLP-dependent transferase n=1 Tax=Epithele typhae TaxID=378194 RepID=UPI002008E7FB|nr:PLP-dependent transferase [Epithele typhae]KAH9926557.1 PLP-dependent transferase [Epithele typhae]